MRPTATFNVDACGAVSPDGWSVTNVFVVAPVAVRFTTTASAVTGTPAAPRTVAAALCPAPNGVAMPPMLLRESSRHVGSTAL